MDSKENEPKDPYHMTPDEIKAYYEKAKREFCLDDLKQLFVEEDGQPFGELIAELEQMVKKAKGEGNGQS